MMMTMIVMIVRREFYVGYLHGKPFERNTTLAFRLPYGGSAGNRLQTNNERLISFNFHLPVSYRCATP